jgi:hypothetical protein
MDLEKTLEIVFAARNELSGTLLDISNQLNTAFPDAKSVNISASADGASFSVARNSLTAAIPDERDISIKTMADGSTIERAYGMIVQRFPDGQILVTNIGIDTDATNLTAVKNKIADAFPSEKLMEIQAKIDVAQIKADSEIVKTAIQWEAKINIAQIQAATQTLKALFASIDNTITSTGETLVGMFDVWQKARSQGGTNFIEDEIKRESARRDDALESQKKLTEAQVDLLNQQVEAMKSGGAMIQIDGKGLQPHLEAFMFEILKQIQIKANAEGMKFLVGL